MNPFKTQQEINEYLYRQLEDCKRRLDELEENDKKRVRWDMAPIVTPLPKVRKWSCDYCQEPIDKETDEVWFNGHVFCCNTCRNSYDKAL